MDYISYLESKLDNNKYLTYDEVIKLINDVEFERVYNLACKIKLINKGRIVDLCSIQNAKSGKCSENCKYCAQSLYYNTNVRSYKLLDENEILHKALYYQSFGVKRFSLVTSGNVLDDNEFSRIINIYKMLKIKTKMKLCASLGKIDYERAMKLKEAGVDFYHHNIETCRDYYKMVCTTHTYEDRVDTIKSIKKAGLSICCGGIIGLGETFEQRIKMAFEIRDLEVKSIPINILTPVKGTPFEKNVPLSPDEVIKTIAFYRIIIPDADIRYAAGRNMLGIEQKKGFLSGISGAMVGDFLTTTGNAINDDISMIKEFGLEI